MAWLWPPCHVGKGIWDVSLCFQGLLEEAESSLLLIPIDIDTYRKKLAELSQPPEPCPDCSLASDLLISDQLPQAH